MSDKEIQFATLHPDGSQTDIRTLKQETIRKCPHFIIWADHYRPDGTCKCNDPNDKDMATWGYEWDPKAGLWSSKEEE